MTTKLIALFLLFLSVVFLANIKAHQCRLEDCYLKGQIKFRSIHPVDSDAYLRQLTHWQHPEWTQEQIEQHLTGKR